MRMPMFNTKEELREWSLREADLIEKNGLARAIKMYEDACKGIGKDEFILNNHVAPEMVSDAWDEHVAWLDGNVKFLKRKVQKLRKV